MTKRKVIEDSDDEENAEATPPRPSATGLSDITLSSIVCLDGSPSHEVLDQPADPSTSSTELLNRESRAAHQSLIEPTPKSTLPATRIYSSSQQQTPTSPLTSPLAIKRSKTSEEKLKAKKPLKTYGKSSLDLFEFHGASDGELDITSKTSLSHKPGRGKHGHSKAAEIVNSQVSPAEDVTKRTINSSGGDTELQRIGSSPNEISSAGGKDVSLQSSMPPPPSRFTSFEQSQQSPSSTTPTIADPTPLKSTTRNPLPPARVTRFEIHIDDGMPASTGSPRGDVDYGRSPDSAPSGKLTPNRSKVEMKANDRQPSEERALSSSAHELSHGKAITVQKPSNTKNTSREPSPHLDDEYLQPQLESIVSTTVNPVVLLPAPLDAGEGFDELSLSIPEKLNKSPTKAARGSKRKTTNEDGPVDELGSDDNEVGIPKEQYKPRPSKRRSGDRDEEIFIPTDFSKKPELIGKVKRKTKRRKTTAFQELLPQAEAEEEDEEVTVAPDPSFEISEKKTSRISTEGEEEEVDRKVGIEDIRAKAQPEGKPAAKGKGQKQRGRPKKVVTNISKEKVMDEAEADHDQEDAEAEEPATAKKSRKNATIRKTPKPIIEEQDHNSGSALAAGDDSEDLPAEILNETHGNIIASNLSAKLLPETSPTKANTPPETPRKPATPAPKGPDKHSPVSSGKVAYRVGLSKRARIAPLLRIVRK